MTNADPHWLLTGDGPRYRSYLTSAPALLAGTYHVRDDRRRDLFDHGTALTGRADVHSTECPPCPCSASKALRAHPRLRDLVREHRLTVDDLVYPLFVYHGTNLRREIRLDAGAVPALPRPLARGDRRGGRAADSRRPPLRHPRAQGSHRVGSERRGRDRAAGLPLDQAASPRPPRHHRRLLLRVHRPRPLRPVAHPRRRPGRRRQRRHAPSWPNKPSATPRRGRMWSLLRG